MKNLFIIVLLLVISTSLFSDDFYEILNEDFLPTDSLIRNQIQYRFGHLIDSIGHYLIGYDFSNLSVFGFKDNYIELIHTFDIKHLNLGYKNQFKCIVGDFNNNKVDEIIFYLNKRIILFEWNGHEFQLTEYESPYYIHQCIIGDVTNNGKNELIMSCMDDSLEKVYPHGEYDTHLRVLLATLESGNIAFFYNKKTDLNLRINAIMPSDKLVATFDIDNNGINKLIISNMQSDVSPTYYRIYLWDNELKSFNLFNQFEITNLHLNPTQLKYENLINYVTGTLHPISLNKTNYFLANIWGANKSFTSHARLLSIEDNNLMCHGEIEEKGCWAYNTFIFQTDNNTICILLLSLKNYNREYKLYYKLGYVHF